MRAKFPFNRRTREIIFRATAVLSLGIWLLMSMAEVCPPLHAWLHGGKIPDDDNCAVVALAHGKVEIVSTDIPVFVPITGIEIVPRAEFFFFVPPSKNLLFGRAPPVSLTVS
jgi:hypothetical protein